MFACLKLYPPTVTVKRMLANVFSNDTTPPRVNSRGRADSRRRAELILHGRHSGAGLRGLRGTLSYESALPVKQAKVDGSMS